MNILRRVDTRDKGSTIGRNMAYDFLLVKMGQREVSLGTSILTR